MPRQSAQGCSAVRTTDCPWRPLERPFGSCQPGLETNTESDWGIGFSRKGEVFELAINRLNSSEFAGATFSPDGQILFVNIFGESAFVTDGNEGMTIAITGPWDHGPL